ncbi:MAG: hypothetical protein IKK21_09230 [Clostridia bacterium]|nr:hypothetical protein [Clostridia bacterium]
MKFDREIVFSYLEEDNTQRAYFRLKPLLTVSGDVQEEAARLWPDHGALRIVPDKNEQGYFKDRMRTLGHWCIMDLTPFPPEANKIRTNKNYRPDRDERNQYILYSDTVKPVPDHTFFEVLEGDPADFAALAENAVTTAFMIRQGDNLYGPVLKQSPAAPAAAPEMTAMVYELPCPDGTIRTMLCAAPPAAAEPEEVPAAEKSAPVQEAVLAEAPDAKKPADQEAMPIGKPLEILDKTKDFSQTLEDLNQPLSQRANLLSQPETEPEDSTPPPVLTGTPLVRTGALHTSQPRPKNKVQEVVASQLRVIKNDPPAEPLPVGAKLRSVDNPVEQACQQFTRAWSLPDAQPQLVEYLLSLPGMSARLAPAADGDTPLQKAMVAHLNDLEAERLSALVQLERAQEQYDAFRAQAISAARTDAQKKLRELEEKLERCQKHLDDVRQQINTLSQQRDALQNEVAALQQERLPAAIVSAMTRAKMAQPVQGTPMYLRARVGDDAAVEQLVNRLITACRQSGVDCPRNQAIAVLALIAVCRKVGIVSPSPAAALTLTENLIGAMGWRSGYAHQTNDDQRPVPEKVSDDGTPLLFLSTTGVYGAYPDVTNLYLARSISVQTRRAAFDCDPWPILPLGMLPFIPRADAACDGQPVTLAALLKDKAAFDVHGLETLKPVLDLMPPLSGRAADEMKQFINICAAHMEGGLSAACDWAITLWLLSHAEGNHQMTAALRPLLAEYPVSLARL